MIKILDIQPYQEVTKEVLDFFTFSDGGLHVDVSGLNPHIDEIYLEVSLHNSDSIMQLLLVCDAIYNYTTNKDIVIDLRIRYLPYSRQDRVCSAGQAFSLNVMANLLNSIKNIGVIYTWDVHSDVACKLIPKLRNVSQISLIKPYLTNMATTKHVLVCPDKGAILSTAIISNKYPFKDVIHATKIRDSATGNIISTVMPELTKLSSEEKYVFLIVDDICDGGRTFSEIAKVIHAHSPKSIVKLWITHAICTKGIPENIKYLNYANKLKLQET